MKSPQETLSEIKKLHELNKEISPKYRDSGKEWLINRVLQLETALGFYADLSNWGENMRGGVEIADSDTEEMGDGFCKGGVTAREALTTGFQPVAKKDE